MGSVILSTAWLKISSVGWQRVESSVYVKKYKNQTSAERTVDTADMEFWCSWHLSLILYKPIFENNVWIKV